MEAPTGPTGSPATHAGQSHTPPGQNPRPSQTAQNTHFANVRYANFAKCMFCGALHRGNDDNDGSESARTVWRKDTRAPGGGQRHDDGSESRRARPRRPTRR